MHFCGSCGYVLPDILHISVTGGCVERKFQELKTTEGGIRAMCELMEQYNREAVKKDRIEKIQALLKHNCDKEFILSVGYSEEEYDEAEKVFNEQS